MDACHEHRTSCWHLLGLEQQRRLQLRAHADGAAMLTERDITKAYREKARRSHPDRFLNAEDKESATIEFRGIHDAKEEALEAVRNPTRLHACDVCFKSEEQHEQDDAVEHNCSEEEQTDHPSSKTAFKRPNAAMAQMVTAATDDLDREFDERWKHRVKVTLDSLFQAWPDKNQTWAIFRSSSPLLSHLKPGLRPDIYNHLARRQDERRDEYAMSKQVRLQNLVKDVKDNWNSDREQLLQNIQLNWSGRDFKDASNMVGSSEIAEALRDCYDEKMRQFHERRTAAIKKAAEDISSVFPDMPAIKLILKSLWLRNERRLVLASLQEDMREQMTDLCLEYGTFTIEQKQTEPAPSSNKKRRQPRNWKRQAHKPRYGSHSRPTSRHDANAGKNDIMKLWDNLRMISPRRFSPDVSTTKLISKIALQMVLFSVVASHLHHGRHLASPVRCHRCFPIAVSFKESVVSIPFKVARYLWSFIV